MVIRRTVNRVRSKVVNMLRSSSAKESCSAAAVSFPETEKAVSIKKAAASDVSKISTGRKPALKGKKTLPSGTKKTEVSNNELFAMIQKKAYEFYMKRGCAHGSDQEDWKRAEKEIKQMIGAK